LVVSAIILAAGLAYPVVSSYNKNLKGRHIINDGGTIFEPGSNEPPPPPALPPLPPPPAMELVKKIKFIVPKVVDDVLCEFPVSLNQDDFNTSDVNQPVVNIETVEVTEKQTPIEIIDNKEPEIYVQEMPSFPGGDAERLKFLKEQIMYPTEAVENGIQGTVYIQFIVDSKGNITDVKVLRGIGGGCDEEAVRVTKLMPEWHPGRQNGQNVRVLFNMAVNFKLNS
jgi:protein TonB